jgi:hypothetical protein
VSYPVYSVRFLQARAYSGVATYLVPAGFVAVLRDLDAFQVAGLTVPQIYLVGAAGQTIWWNSGSLVDSSYSSWRGRQVINEGETFAVNVATETASFAVSGYLLSLP